MKSFYKQNKHRPTVSVSEILKRYEAKPGVMVTNCQVKDNKEEIKMSNDKEIERIEERLRNYTFVTKVDLEEHLGDLKKIDKWLKDNGYKDYAQFLKVQSRNSKVAQATRCLYYSYKLYLSAKSAVAYIDFAGKDYVYNGLIKYIHNLYKFIESFDECKDINECDFRLLVRQ